MQVFLNSLSPVVLMEDLPQLCSGTVNGSRVQDDRYHETSQLILDTSLDSVYDNRLRVRGRRSGTYNCTVGNNIRDFLPQASTTEVNGSMIITGTYLYIARNITITLINPPSGRRAHQSYCSHL